MYELYVYIVHKRFVAYSHGLSLSLKAWHDKAWSLNSRPIKLWLAAIFLILYRPSRPLLILILDYFQYKNCKHGFGILAIVFFKPFLFCLRWPVCPEDALCGPHLWWYGSGQHAAQDHPSWGIQVSPVVVNCFPLHCRLHWVNFIYLSHFMLCMLKARRSMSEWGFS